MFTSLCQHKRKLWLRMQQNKFSLPKTKLTLCHFFWVLFFVENYFAAAIWLIIKHKNQTVGLVYQVFFKFSLFVLKFFAIFFLALQQQLHAALTAASQEQKGKRHLKCKQKCLHRKQNKNSWRKIVSCDRLWISNASYGIKIFRIFFLST